MHCLTIALLKDLQNYRQKNYQADKVCLIMIRAAGTGQGWWSWWGGIGRLHTYWPYNPSSLTSSACSANSPLCSAILLPVVALFKTNVPLSLMDVKQDKQTVFLATAARESSAGTQVCTSCSKWTVKCLVLGCAPITHPSPPTPPLSPILLIIPSLCQV